jgi:hypothetical protein
MRNQSFVFESGGDVKYKDDSLLYANNANLILAAQSLNRSRYEPPVESEIFLHAPEPQIPEIPEINIENE